MDDDCARFGGGDGLPLAFSRPTFREKKVSLFRRRVLDTDFVRFVADEEARRVVVEAHVSIFRTKNVVIDRALMKYVTVVRDTVVLGQVSLRGRRIWEDRRP